MSEFKYPCILEVSASKDFNPDPYPNQRQNRLQVCIGEVNGKYACIYTSPINPKTGEVDEKKLNDLLNNVIEWSRAGGITGLHIEFWRGARIPKSKKTFSEWLNNSTLEVNI